MSGLQHDGFILHEIPHEPTLPEDEGEAGLLSRNQLGYAAARHGGPVRCWYFLKPRHLQRIGTTQPMAYRSARADYLDTKQVTLKLFIYTLVRMRLSSLWSANIIWTRYITRKGSAHVVSLESRNHGPSTAIPALVHPVLSPISVTSALIDPQSRRCHYCPLCRPLMPYLNVMLPVYKPLPSSGSVLVTEKHAIPARSTNPISF
jgi:hypothetical protein